MTALYDVKRDEVRRDRIHRVRVQDESTLGEP
jgi:hypothetical protein